MNVSCYNRDRYKTDNYRRKEENEMDIEKKLELIADILDIELGDISPEMEFSGLEDWDSVAILSFIAMMDEVFGKEIKGAEIKKFVTIQDALDVMKE